MFSPIYYQLIFDKTFFFHLPWNNLLMGASRIKLICHWVCHTSTLASNLSQANVNHIRAFVNFFLLIMKLRLTAFLVSLILQFRPSYRFVWVYYLFTKTGALGNFKKLTREELKQMEQRTRKIMIMHEALYPRDDVDRKYVSRKEGGKVSVSIEDSVDASIERLEDYIEKHEGGLITSIRNEGDNTMDNTITITRNQNWEEKQLNEHFKRLINNISHQKTWTWLRKGNFKREKEYILKAAQNNVITTNRMKREKIKRNKIANVGYVVIETKRSIT